MEWIDVPILPSKSGTELCGWISFGLYLASAIACFLPELEKRLSDIHLFFAIAPAILASSSIVWQMLSLREEYVDLIDNPISKVLNFQIEYKAGLYLSLLCGIFIAIAAVILRVIDMSKADVKAR